MKTIFELLKENTMYLYVLASISLLIMCILLILNKKYHSKKYDNYPYILRRFLSEHEHKYYKALEPIANKYNYKIMSKVRLADIVEVKKGLNNSEYYSYFDKIRSKHVNFVLCDNTTINPILIIEVDDRSHNRPDRINRDRFIDNLFKEVKLPIIHVKNLQYLENQIVNALQPISEQAQKQST